MLTLAIDPGLRECGLAWYRDQTLVRCGLAVNPDRHGRGLAAWRSMAQACFALWRPRGTLDDLVVELPQVYGSGRGKGDPNDLLQLTGVLGAIGGYLRAQHYHEFTPRAWKGQVPKAVHHDRVVNVWLSESELAALRLGCEDVKSDLKHNVLDAVGLGLHWHKRDR